MQIRKINYSEMKHPLNEDRLFLKTTNGGVY